jgi:DNA gyrase subunit A
MRPNYASTTEEPEVLPAQFPNLLVNGALGVAVGMATNIPPHNLKEVCNALVALLDNRELPLEKLTRHILGPDFPTGGVILNTPDEIREIYAIGQGSIKVRGTYEPDPDKPNTVLITSIPYGIEKDALVQRIGELIGKGQVPQLTNVKDLSTEDIRISLELRPNANAAAALAYLFKNTPLQTNFNVNLTCLLPAAGAAVAVPARLDLKSVSSTSSTSGSRWSRAASNMSWPTFWPGSISSKASQSSSRTSTKRSRSSAPATARPTPPPSSSPGSA